MKTPERGRCSTLTPACSVDVGCVNPAGAAACVHYSWFLRDGSGMERHQEQKSQA